MGLTTSSIFYKLCVLQIITASKGQKGMTVPEMNFCWEECIVLTRHIRFVTKDQLVAIEPIDDGVDGPHGRVNWGDVWALVGHADRRFAFGGKTFAGLQEVDVIGGLDLEILLLWVCLNVGQVDDLGGSKIIIWRIIVWYNAFLRNGQT